MKTPHERRLAVVNSLLPQDRASALFRLIWFEMLELDILAGGDEALDDLARAALAIAYRAVEHIADADLRRDLAAMASKAIAEVAVDPRTATTDNHQSRE